MSKPEGRERAPRKVTQSGPELTGKGIEVTFHASGTRGTSLGHKPAEGTPQDKNEKRGTLRRAVPDRSNSKERKHAGKFVEKSEKNRPLAKVDVAAEDSLLDEKKPKSYDDREGEISSTTQGNLL